MTCSRSSTAASRACPATWTSTAAGNRSSGPSVRSTSASTARIGSSRRSSIAQRRASHPRDFDAFVEGVTLYHIVIEATIALTGQRFELEAMREQGLTDRGFYRGFTAVARDESRHVNFGIKVLQEAVRENAERYAPLIQKTLVECLPLITGTLDPPDPRYITEFGHTESEIVEFAFDSLHNRLRAIGINLAA